MFMCVRRGRKKTQKNKTRERVERGRRRKVGECDVMCSCVRRRANIEEMAEALWISSP